MILNTRKKDGNGNLRINVILCKLNTLYQNY